MSAKPTPPPTAGELWEDAPLPCLVIDRRGRIDAANRAAAALLERGAPRLAGADLHEQFSPARPLAPCSLAQGEPRQRHHRGTDRSPLRTVPARGVAPPALDGPPAGARGCSRGGSTAARTRELERRLARSEKLSAMAIVAGKVAHEIRSPLNSIFLNSDLLQERVRRMGGPQAQHLLRYCRVLEEEVERLNEIVESYLALARLAGGERQATDAEDFLRRLVADVAAEHERREIAIVTAFRARRRTCGSTRGKCGGCSSISSPTLARRHEGRRPHQPSPPRTPPPANRITVSEHGEGIPPEALSRLSTPFTTLKENGSGLGLFLAREILQDHGGRLEIQSLQARARP